jgi:hypothetical protein
VKKWLVKATTTWYEGYEDSQNACTNQELIYLDPSHTSIKTVTALSQQILFHELLTYRMSLLCQTPFCDTDKYCSSTYRWWGYDTDMGFEYIFTQQQKKIYETV